MDTNFPPELGGGPMPEGDGPSLTCECGRAFLDWCVCGRTSEQFEREPMNELEELKVRAAERRKKVHKDPMQTRAVWIGSWNDAETDLDRAIALAEQNAELAERNREGMNRNSRNADQFAQERDKARAAGLALRDHILAIHKGLTIGAGTERVLTDTAWLEEHR